MNDQRFDESEWQAQERARALEQDRAGPSGDPCVDRYRLAFRALQHATRTPMPLDFAASVVRRAAQFDREDTAERWVLRAVGGIVGVVLALYAGPMLLDALASGLRSSSAAGPALGMLRNPWLWTALLATAAAALVDRGWSHR
jgi:hypothetical protein